MVALERCLVLRWQASYDPQRHGNAKHGASVGTGEFVPTLSLHASYLELEEVPTWYDPLFFHGGSNHTPVPT